MAVNFNRYRFIRTFFRKEGKLKILISIHFFHGFTVKIFLSAVYFSYLNGNPKTTDLFILYIYMT